MSLTPLVTGLSGYCTRSVCVELCVRMRVKLGETAIDAIDSEVFSGRSTTSGRAMAGPECVRRRDSILCAARVSADLLRLTDR